MRHGWREAGHRGEKEEEGLEGFEHSDTNRHSSYSLDGKPRQEESARVKKKLKAGGRTEGRKALEPSNNNLGFLLVFFADAIVGTSR